MRETPIDEYTKRCPKLWQAKWVTVGETIDLLNEINSIDPDALLQLVNIRVRCNKALVEHPSVQVRAESMGRIFDPSVSFLGIINGIFGAHPETRFGHITMECDTDKNNPWVVTKIKKFRLTEHPDQMQTESN